MEPNQTPSIAPKPKFNLWLVTTIVLAVALIAGGIVFAWQKSVNGKVKNDLQGQINILQNQIQQLTKTTPTDVTADWKTYTDTKYGFEIKYPNDWTKETDYILYSYVGYGYVGFKKEDSTQEKITGGDGLFTPFYLININVSDNSKGVSLKDFALQALQKGSVLKKDLTYTQVAGQQAVSLEVAGGYLPGPDVVTIIACKGRFYTLNYSGVVHSETNYKFIDIYNQMLSTFKFTK